jgi:hypothetical protein
LNVHVPYRGLNREKQKELRSTGSYNAAQELPYIFLIQIPILFFVLDLQSANGNPLHLQLAFFRIEQFDIVETRLECSGYAVMTML